jgi:hypothetical protein
LSRAFTTTARTVTAVTEWLSAEKITGTAVPAAGVLAVAETLCPVCPVSNDTAYENRCSVWINVLLAQSGVPRVGQ